MKTIFESLPMPKCGEKSTEGCYDCIGQNDCEFLKTVNELPNMYLGTCPICGGTTMNEEITSTNPGAMTISMSDNCDYRCNQFLDYEDFRDCEIF